MALNKQPSIRVFVSSVMENFQEYRAAARQGIVDAGGEPVMAEDFGALPDSSHNACLDAVKSSDLFILVIGSRGGWTAPSGKLVVEEEVEEAKRNHIPVFVFLQNAARDVGAEKLAKRMSDYIAGVFRPTFDTPQELSLEVQKALTPQIQHHYFPKTDTAMIQDLMQSPAKLYEEAVLRFVVAPDKAEEVIDPVSLESPELERELMELAHHADVGLFSYRCNKSTQISPSEIIIVQGKDDFNRDGMDFVSLSLNTAGCLVFDINVTNRPHLNPDGEWQFDSLVIVESEIVAALDRCWSFVKFFWEDRDPYRRYDRMTWNASLGSIGHRNLVAEYPKGNSVPVNMLQHDGSIVAFDNPRKINRTNLMSYEGQINDALSLLRRRFQHS